MIIRRIIHRENPYSASAIADEKGRRIRARDPERVRFFSEREVQNPDGTFPFGEGFLYDDDVRPRRAQQWTPGSGVPSDVAVAGHHGSKREQQDAFLAFRFRTGPHEGAALVVADGVSSAGPLAKKSSHKAVEVFSEALEREMTRLPRHEAKRRTFVERAIKRAAFAANFEVVRQVLFDTQGDGRFDEADRRKLARRTGIDVPTGPLTPSQMQRLAPRLDPAVSALAEEGRLALTTFAVAVAVGNDLYTFSCGDAVVALYRPSEPKGRRFLHLTHRDQQVVHLFRDEDQPLEAFEDVYENVITDSFGGSAMLSGTLRRYPNLLEPGDRVVACSDGIGPRGPRRGLTRHEIEDVLEKSDDGSAAWALVRAQISDLEPGEYQDNIGVAVLTIGAANENG